MAYDKSLPVSSHNRIPCGEEEGGGTRQRIRAMERKNGRKKNREGETEGK